MSEYHIIEITIANEKTYSKTMIKAKVTKGGGHDFDEVSEYRDAFTNLNKSDLVRKS